MKGKLVSFEVEEIAVNDTTPYIKRLYPAGLNKSISFDEAGPAFGNMMETRSKVFELIKIRESGKDDVLYFVNRDDVKHTFLIVKEVIRQELKELTTKNTILELKLISTNNKLNKLERTLVVKAMRFVQKVVRYLRSEIERLLNKEVT